MEEAESPTQLELQNQSLRDQVDGLNKELELVRRANTRRKQAALSDGSELRRVDRALQKFKRDNASARDMLESVRARSAAPSMALACALPTTQPRPAPPPSRAQQSSTLEVVQQLQNTAAELTHKLEEQEAENALLHKVHARKQQGLAAQGPSELQQQEQTRLKAQHRELQTQLRKGHAQATELATQRSKLQRRHAKASDKRDRLHKALVLAATDRADPDGKGGGGGGGGAAEGGGGAGAEEDATLAKAERALKMAEQKRRGQQRRFQVQMRDSLAELKGLKSTLEAMTLQVAEDAPPPPRPRPAHAPPPPEPPPEPPPRPAPACL